MHLPKQIKVHCPLNTTTTTFFHKCTQSLMTYHMYQSLRMAMLVYPEFTAFHHKVATQTSSPLQVLRHTIIGPVPP